MEQSTSWQADSRSAGQEIPSLLWNSRFQYRFHTNPPPSTILIYLNPVHKLTIFSWSVLILSSYLCLCLRNCPLPSVVSTKLVYAFSVSIWHVTCSANVATHTWDIS